MILAGCQLKHAKILPKPCEMVGKNCMAQLNVKFSKGPVACIKHKSEDIEKSLRRIKKTYKCFL